MKQQNRRPSLEQMPLLAFTLLLSLLFALMAVVYGGPAHAAGNTLTLETVTAPAGTSGSFAITLDNSDAVASGQLRFTYAADFGLTITGVQVTGRTTGFATTGSPYNTGNATLTGYQVLFYNLSNLTITPGAGAILTISYTLAPNASGSTALRFTQAILSSSAAQALPVSTGDGALTIAAPTATATATSTATSPPASTATATLTPTPTATSTATSTATALENPVTTTPTLTPTAPTTEFPPTVTSTATSTVTATTSPDGTTSTPTPVAILLPAQIYLPLIQR